MKAESRKSKDERLTPNETWLSLKGAAAQMNVHCATVRRWADAGELPHMLTPGGHRRFALSAIQAFLFASSVQNKAVTAQPAKPIDWATQAMNHAREDMSSQVGGQWMTTMSDATRERHRLVGRKLMALTLQFLTAEDGAHLLAEARAVGHEYGGVSLSAGIALSDALQAALFFRDKLLEASLDLPETTQLRSKDQSKLLKRINTLLNTVQIAIAGAYEQRPTPPTQTLSSPNTSTGKETKRNKTIRK